MKPARGQEEGFSLVEALIALAIIAAMTGVMIETVAADARARLALRQRQEALMIARSALDRASYGDDADAGRVAGPGPPLAWHVEREPFEDGSPPFAATRLERLTVTVEDAARRPLARLATVRIAQ